jgi:hypothetical protein
MKGVFEVTWVSIGAGSSVIISSSSAHWSGSGWYAVFSGQLGSKGFKIGSFNALSNMRVIVF